MATMSQVVPDALEWPFASQEADRELRIREAPSTADLSMMPRQPASDKSSEKDSEKNSASVTVEEVENPLSIIGSTNIYDDHGKIRLIPTPPPDPRDPLNLPNWRKYTAIGCLCFFGSLSLCADFVVSGLLPVFILEYSGVDPRPILKTANMQGNPSPLAIVPPGVVPISLYQVTLLSTLPPLSNCVASYLFVPLSLAVGRRPVLLVTALCSCIGGFWAGYSTSLRSHLYARLVHGLGSATVEGLLPLIMQDMVFIHQRNRAIAAILACQGPLMTLFGVLSPYIATNYSWRWIYWITSGVGVLAWVLLIIFVPETRKVRSKQELNGQQLWPIAPGKNRTDLDYATYGKRTWKDDFGVLNHGYEWKETGVQILRTLQTSYFPSLLLVVVLDTAFMVVMQSTGQTISFALLAAGVPYELSGLHVITGVLSAAVVYLLGGPLADKLTLKVSRLRKQKGREPEYQLPNLVLPFVFAIVGCLLFGLGQARHWHFSTLFVGSFCLFVGALTAASILKTFIIESYPHWPGPVLVSVSTLRTLLTFFIASHATTWVQELGPLKVFSIYMAVLGGLFLTVPLFYLYGKHFRSWTAGTVEKKARAPDVRGGGSGLTRVASSDTVDTEVRGLNKVASIETVSSVDKSLNRVVSRETVATMDSIDRHLGEKRSQSSW